MMWAGYRQFFRHVPRQFIRPLRFARLVDGRRNLRVRVSRRIFRRGLRRLPGLDRRIFDRIDRHHIAIYPQRSLGR
jgi:hypothetical protein